MADTEQPTEDIKLDDADAAIDASIDAAHEEHGGESYDDSTNLDVDNSERNTDVQDETTSEKIDKTGSGVSEAGSQKKATDIADEGTESESGKGDESSAETGVLEAPTHWPSGERELFTKQPKDVQEWMTSRIKHQDADYTRKTQEIAPLRNAVQKWIPYLTQTGQTPEYAFDLLMSAEQRLRTGTAQEKVQVLQALSADFHIPLEGLAPPQGEQVEPDEQQLMQMHVNQAIQPYQQQLQNMQDYEASKHATGTTGAIFIFRATSQCLCR